MNSTATQVPDEQVALPALYSHSKDVYEAMLRASSKQPYREGGEDKEAVVYEGFLTKLLTEDLRLSVPYYTSVMDALKRMGCARQLRRGGSTSPSQWVLYHEPTEDLFRDNVLKKGRRKASSQHGTRLDQLEDSLLQLNRRVSTLEGILLHLGEQEKQEGEEANVL